MEHLLDDILKVSDLLGAGQLGEQDNSSVAFPGDIVHFETFEIVNESLRDVIVLEQHCFLGLVYVGNLSLDKLGVCVASQLLSSNFSY